MYLIMNSVYEDRDRLLISPTYVPARLYVAQLIKNPETDIGVQPEDQKSKIASHYSV